MPMYRIAGNFRMVQIFAYFAWGSHMRKYKLRIFKYVKFFKCQILNGYTTNQSGNDYNTCEVQSSKLRSRANNGVVYVSVLPNWTPFLTPADLCLHPLALQPLRMLMRQWEVLHVSQSQEPKFTPEQQTAIGEYEYASLHGNQAAIRHVSKQLGEAVHAKFKNTKFYSKGNSVINAKICTYQNFPLYGIMDLRCSNGRRTWR